MPLEAAESLGVPRAPTGISGFDALTLGGLPAGRPTLVCGGPGSGKTLFGLTFLINGALQHGEPGVFMSFEERAEDLTRNVRSLGYDLDALAQADKVKVDYVQVERSEIEEAGEYDLEGLFIRLGFAVECISAKRVVLDTIEALFSGFTDPAILRAELRRLFGWIRERGLTAVITGERGEGPLTRHGLEEYVSDCVVLLDNRVENQIATRRLRIVKYRGSSHGSDEFPFLIDVDGITVLPVTTRWQNPPVSSEIVPTGIVGLDGMLRSGGFYRGSGILISGVSGSGKTTIACQFVGAACRRSERCMVFAFEESTEEICRNARSVGLDLLRDMAAGVLRFSAARPSLYGLELHLARMHRDVEAFDPTIVVVDPISAFRGPSHEVHSVLLRLIDLLKSRGITAMLTSLTGGVPSTEGADQSVSSIMDGWVRLTDVQENGERNRILSVVKARGMSHSNHAREYRMTDAGVELIEPYIGPGGVLTGTARLIQEERDRADAGRREQERERRKRHLAQRRAAVERQVAELQAALEVEEHEQTILIAEEEAEAAMLAARRGAVAARRSAPG